MDLTVWLALAALAAASYLSTIHLSLLGVSHAVLRRRLAAKDREPTAGWLLDRRRAALLCTSLLQTVCRVTFFVLVLVRLVGVGESARLSASNLALAAAVAVILLWLATSALASTIARYAGTGVVVHSLPLVKVLTWLGLPLARLLALLDEVVRRLTGANLVNDEHGEEELLRSIEESQLQGRLDEEAAEMMENVVEFRSTDVGEVMTPRTDIKGIELTDDLCRIRQIIIELGYSRIPVYEENLDHISGILYVKDLVPLLGEEATGFSLRKHLREPIRVPETKPVRELLADFQRSEVHMAIVIDEYGGTAGLVTIEDVLEELVGEIQDEHDLSLEEVPALVTIDESHAEVDGRFHIDDLNEQLGLDLPEDDEFDTVAGFVLARLGRVPAVGDSFEAHNARFTALEATPTHVRKVGIELLAPARVNGEK